MHDEFVVEGAGFRLDYSKRTGIMGILNITPDSFYDGGWYQDTDTAVDHALRLIDEGADIIDIGGESTKPGAEAVCLEEELNRVIPVIKKLEGQIEKPISIDTRSATVARQAIHAGARMVNDVSGLTADPDMVETVASVGVPVVIMHTAGNPRDMQNNPRYQDTVREIFKWLNTRIDYAAKNGIQKSKIIVDPGIGFGKRLSDNLLILRSLDFFRKLERPILIGPSRKSFIGCLLDVAENDRLEGTAAAVALGIANGASLVRVHDVKEMGRVARMADAICRSRQE